MVGASVEGEQGCRRSGQESVAADLRDLINRFADHVGLRDPPCYLAMGTVFAEQCEIVADRVIVRKKTGGACVQNPSDLDATYLGKSGKAIKFNSVGRARAETTFSSSSAHCRRRRWSRIPRRLLQDLQKQELLSEKKLADTAYGSAENVRQAAALDVAVLNPVAGPQRTYIR